VKHYRLREEAVKGFESALVKTSWPSGGLPGR